MAKKKPAPEPEKVPEPEPETVMGRPTDYRPEYTREALLLCKLGATDAQLADAFDVTVRTINRWKVTHEGFAEAIRKGKNPADDRVEDTLYHRAVGTEYEKAHPIKLKKITYGPDGKKIQEEERIEVVMVKEVIPPDTTALIFWLKNRRKEQWRDLQSHEHGKPGDFSNLSDAELDDLIAQALPAEVTQPEPAKRNGKTKH